MTTKHRDLAALAANYHAQMPRRIRGYLNDRGIPDVVIDYFLLGWNGARITIPIFNRDGNLAFFKLRRDPDDPLPGPKMMASPGAYAELYGWEELAAKVSPLIICEGEFDRLVLTTRRFHAVTSTGGASVFREAWAAEFDAITDVFVCYDNDEAGRRGALRVARMIPHAKIVELPGDVGGGGDVSDFFVRLGASDADFNALLAAAKPAPPTPEPPAPKAASVPDAESPDRQRINRLKAAVRVTDIVGRYLKLQTSGEVMVAACPFHEDRTPSLVVFPATDTFYCFGCRHHGDVITFLRSMEQLSFQQALDELERFGNGHHGAEAQ